MVRRGQARRLTPRPGRRGRADEERDDEDPPPLHEIQYSGATGRGARQMPRRLMQPSIAFRILKGNMRKPATRH